MRQTREADRQDAAGRELVARTNRTGNFFFATSTKMSSAPAPARSMTCRCRLQELRLGEPRARVTSTPFQPLPLEAALPHWRGRQLLD